VNTESQFGVDVTLGICQEFPWGLNRRSLGQ